MLCKASSSNSQVRLLRFRCLRLLTVFRAADRRKKLGKQGALKRNKGKGFWRGEGVKALALNAVEIPVSTKG